MPVEDLYAFVRTNMIAFVSLQRKQWTDEDVELLVLRLPKVVMRSLISL
jgi:hypothetical protein